MNLECVDLNSRDRARVEYLSSIVGVKGMDLDAMSLEELLYFALVDRVEAA